MQKLKDRLKNLLGKRTKRKLVAFYVDDWGGVRTRNKEAVSSLKEKGVPVEKSRFTSYDTLASAADLDALFEVLRSVQDKNGNSACFTAVMNPCNPNLDAIRANGFTEFVSEPFTKTLEKYGYHKAFDKWKEGIAENIFYPIFHGTEHVSRKQLLKALQEENKPDVWAFEFDSVGVPGSLKGVMRPYYIESAKDNEALSVNIKEGLDEFEKMFGFRARQFRAGGDVISPELYPALRENGIEYMDETMYVKRYIGNGKYARSFNYTGKTNKLGQKLVVRNCIFEPSSNHTFDSVSRCLELVDAAFSCKKPAIISSHRANYVSGIDINNRNFGLERLSVLLNEIVKRYPDVEFVNADQLGDILYSKENYLRKSK